jgi:hypothetical protein
MVAPALLSIVERREIGTEPLLIVPSSRLKFHSRSRASGDGNPVNLGLHYEGFIIKSGLTANEQQATEGGLLIRETQRDSR